MPSGFTAKIEEPATYRVVPEDPSLGHGINVPYLASDAKLDPGSRMVLRAEGWAEYGTDGKLCKVHVPEGWRLESWGDVEESRRLSFEELLERAGLKKRRRPR